jgi:hypothetical protein
MRNVEVQRPLHRHRQPRLIARRHLKTVSLFHTRDENKRGAATVNPVPMVRLATMNPRMCLKLLLGNALGTYAAKGYIKANEHAIYCCFRQQFNKIIN